MHSLSTQHHAYQSFLLLLPGISSICVVVARCVNFRQNVYLNMNYSFLTTMNERDLRTRTVVTFNGADKVTYHENF